QLVASLPLPAHRLVLGEALQALDEATARRDRLTDHIAELVPAWSLAWLVEALQALRGFPLINAVTLAAEIGDPRRLAKASQPEPADGLSRPGAERALDERQSAALRPDQDRQWAHPQGADRSRLDLQPTGPRATRHLASRPGRRGDRDQGMPSLEPALSPADRPRQRPVIAVAAIARELSGFVWAIAQAAGPAATPQRSSERSSGR